MKQGEEEETQSKSNGKSKGKGGRKSKGKTQDRSKARKGKQVRFGEEEETKETLVESTDEPEATGRLAEAQTGRGNKCRLVHGGDEKCRTDETRRKENGKGNGGKGEHEGKGGGFGHKGKQQETKGEDNGEEQELGRMTPNMGAGGSHPQAILDPEKE